MFKVKFENNNAYISDIGDFDLPHTLDCGQAFRWEESGGRWHGAAFGRYLELEKLNDGTVVLYGTDENTFNTVWRGYFDLDRDYSEVIAAISENEILKNAAEYAHGIRVLNQEPWETLCSFIISQNNNIPRIKKIIGLLCTNFGERIQGTQYYSFPSARRIADAGMEALDVIRSGFRSKYIYDAAVKVADGSIDLELLKTLPYEEAKSALMSIKGVGEKVANCVLLFSLGFYGAFPVDVWVKKVIIKYYGDDFDSARFGKYAGIAQQYLFYYERSLGNEKQL